MTNILTRARPRLLASVAAGLMAATAITAAVTALPSTPVRAESAAAIDPTRGFGDLVDRVMPAVISVEVKFTNASASEDQSEAPQMPEGMPEQFRDFFKKFGEGQGQQPMPRGPGMAQGSGFVISADGYAVTNNHVVKDADEVSVKLRDGTELPAEVIGTDPKTDLALIKIKSDKPLATVKFAKTEPRVGDWVMAVGNPFGLGGTVTTGIISARGRDIGAGPYDDFLQIDAAINRGNSGGPAFNLEGEVIGINTAIFSPSGGSVGIGFAIPASTAETIIGSLRETGAVTRGWLGVQIQPVTEDLAEGLGLEEAKGAVISDVTEKSPALDAGLKSGDTILKVDGQEVKDARDLARKVAKVKPGTSVPVTIVRDGKEQEIAVKIGVMPGEDQMAAAKGDKSGADLKDLGLKVVPAEDGAGVTVTEVAPDSAAAERGLRPGDVILEVAGSEVHNPADVRDAMKASGKKRVLMLVKSGDSQRFIALPANAG
ncbi:MAG: DegQ family serine endoprotease [Alphaproteobacteria bacterium]|nr:DegQ family serine endoprotease [Alphaproteobacteria bacterium]